MWTKEVPKEEGYYWVKASGESSATAYLHPVHVYRGNREVDEPDTIFSDGENYKITHPLFIEWWSVRIKKPEQVLRRYATAEKGKEKVKVREYYMATMECLLTSGQTELGVKMITAMIAGNVDEAKEALEESLKYLNHEAILEAMDSKFRFWEVEELPEGIRVRTLKPKHDDHYTEEGRKDRKWGITGEIFDVHNSHGLCYDVRHDDGTTGTYDPDEFELVIVR